MKAGKTLTELAQELERQHETKKDFIASTDIKETLMIVPKLMLKL